MSLTTKILIAAILIAYIVITLAKSKRSRPKQSREPTYRPPEEKKDWPQPVNYEPVDLLTHTKTQPSAPIKRHRYMDKFRLLNNPEMALYLRLKEAAPSMIVFAQVSMSQVLYLSKDYKERYRQLGEIGRKSIDFLICRARDSSIVAAIELNGVHHDTEKQRLSDEKKKAALEEAGIPLITFRADSVPDIATIRHALASHLVQRKKNEAERTERIRRATSKGGVMRCR